jgi:hypothetical protein
MGHSAVGVVVVVVVVVLEMRFGLRVRSVSLLLQWVSIVQTQPAGD